MKIFISWSGEVSKNTAEVLKKWIPVFFESAEVFFSPEDIEKGQNWNKRITEELSNCNYGIVCLTSENMNAPWIYFEAGAIAKAFDSSVTALLVDVNLADIQGPLSMFQATKLIEDDIHKLIKSINNNLEHPRSEDTLNNLFNALWGRMEKDFNEIVENITIKPKTKDKAGQNEILESILQAVREQSRLLSNPENILPRSYLSMLTDDSWQNDVDRSDLRVYTVSIIDKIDDMINSKNSLSPEVYENIKDILSYTSTMIRRQRIDDPTISRDLKRLDRRIDSIVELKTTRFDEI